MIDILSLIGKMELKEYTKELGDSYLIDVISPVINQIEEIKSRTALVNYLATLQPLIGYKNSENKKKIEELFKDNKHLKDIDFQKFVNFVIEKQKIIRSLIKKQLDMKMEATLRIGHGLLKLLSHVQDEKAFTKAIFDKEKKTDAEMRIIVTDLCLVERLLEKHFQKY